MEFAVEVKKPRRGRPPKSREEKIQTQDAAEAARSAEKEPPAAVAAVGKILSWINRCRCHAALTTV